MNKKETSIYNLEINQALELLESSHEGLSSHEVLQRQKKYGPNELTAKKTPLWKRAIEPFASYFAGVIIFAALISVYEHKWLEAMVISFILIVNAIIFYVQQFSVDRVLRSLRSQDKQILSVMRNGKLVELASEDIVVGDIVHLNEGMKVPADGRLIDSTHLQIDESLLTGESLPVHKLASAIDGDKQVYDQKNMVFKGSYVRGGMGLMAVSATGDRTQLGTINTLASSAGENKTPIEKKIDQLTKQMLIAIAIVSTIVFILAIQRGIEVEEGLRFTLSLVVAAVPEGLPVALTLVLLFSARTMAKQKALVKKIVAMETMGAVTLIVTDKTGTITKNQLAVVESFAAGTNLPDFKKAVSASLNTSQLHNADPLDLLLEKEFGRVAPKGFKKVHEFPFEQHMRMSGTVWKENNTYHLFIKGAPEHVLHYCKTKVDYKNKMGVFTRSGYRTLGFASKKLKHMPKNLDATTLSGMNFEGFVALSDQIRSGVAKAVQDARNAGIKVVMLTGDHIETASHIAEKVGIATSVYEAADSRVIANKSPSQIRKSLVYTKVFGRVLPEHKYALLKAVKGYEITAMTGDGVNDIPALVEADAGLAMGSGADAAKDASDIVLLNSNFPTIVQAIRTGRKVLANVRKMLAYLLTTTTGGVMTMLAALLMNFPLPLTALMILWINLVTDGVSVIPLGLSPSESHQMKHPPRHPRAPLLDNYLVVRICLLAAVMAATVLFVFQMHLDKGQAYAQTAAFVSLIVMQWANALNMNFEYRSWVFNFVNPNYKLLAAITGSILLNIALFNSPIASSFGIVDIATGDLLIAATAPVFIAFIAADLHKLYLHFARQSNNTR
jgi:P-type Ca2+ transporter type 2C